MAIIFNEMGEKMPTAGGKVPDGGEKMLSESREMPGDGEKMLSEGGKVPDGGGKVPDGGGKVPDGGGKVPGEGGKMLSEGGKVPGGNGKETGGNGKEAGKAVNMTGMPVVDDKEVRKKIRELNKLFKGAPEKQLKLAQTEIRRAAFLTVLLEILEADIAVNGYEEEYQNGQNQKGKKKTTAADLYATYTKNLIAVMKQLHSVLDSIDIGDGGDDFDRF